MRTESFPIERIAIYSQDGFGLGHMRRTSAIAWQVLQMNPNVSILTLSDSPLGQFFPISVKHDYVKLPSIIKTAPGQWKATHLGVSFEAILEMRKQIIASALVGFAPQVVLVDHMPHGAMGELIPGLEALKDAYPGSQVVLGLRDILDDPQVIRQRWSVEGAFEAIERYYSRVLVYGMRDVFDLVSQYGFPEAISRLVHYCGFVCNPDQPTNTEKIRASFLACMPERAKFIVAAAGGGADAYPMMSSLLDSIEYILPEQECSVAMITGPFMPAHQVADLQWRARSLPVQVIESVDDSISYMSAADLVISMAGYNTCAEILRLRKPAILIPRRGPSAEQRTRARLFSARRWVESLDPDDLTPDSLGQKILSLLRRTADVQPYSRPDLYGVTVAANHILSMQSPAKVREPVYVQS